MKPRQGTPQQLLFLVDQIRKPVAAKVIYETVVELLVRGGREKTKYEGQPVPERLKNLVRRVTRVCNLNHDYTVAVTNGIARTIMGQNPDLSAADAQKQAKTRWTTDEHAYAEVDPEYTSGNVYRNRATPEKKYIRLYEDMSSKISECIFINALTGEVVDVSWDEQVSFFKTNPKKSGSRKQEDAGLEKQVKFRLVSAENIRYLRCGDIEFHAEESATVEAGA